MRSWYPELATIPQIVAILAGDDHWREEWEPPGTDILPVGHPEPWALVVEDPSEGPLDRLHGYWTPLSEFSTAVPGDAADVLFRLAERFSGPVATLLSEIGQWPVVWDLPIGAFMRWVRMTFKGTLGSLETFQWKLDFGNPGADPFLAEGDAPGVAEAAATDLATQWTALQGDTEQFRDKFRGMAFTEVGAVEWTQEDATDSSGHGGNAEQTYPTGWYMYPTGSRPTANSGVGVCLPYEVSCCVTLQTDTRGPRGRGRCYLPPFSTIAMAGDGTFQPAYVTAAGKFIGNLAAAIAADNGWSLIVVSGRAMQLHEVTEINVGKVPDSQRRRRRSQNEARIIAHTF